MPTQNLNNLTAKQLKRFMDKHGVGENELAEMFGVSLQAVRLWTRGQRELSITNSRLIRLLGKYPALMREF